MPARLLRLCGALAFAVGSGSAVAQIATGDARAWLIQYADGRSVSLILQTTGSMWTQRFPRTAGIESARNGLPLSALDVAYVVDGHDAVFTVSLVYGSGFQERVKVATVRATSEQPVRVEQLKAYAVEPVTLSLLTAPPTLAYPPTVINASGLLEVRVEPVALNVPSYRFVLTNHSTHALTAIQYSLYQGDRLAVSGRRKTPRNEPLARPGQEHVFELPLGGSDGTWPTLDRVEITSVLWDDGLVEGDPTPAAQERAIARGRAAAISRTLELLRSANRFTDDEFRARFASLDLYDGIMRRIRDEALAQFDELQRRGERDALRRWHTEQIADYESWLERIRASR